MTTTQTALLKRLRESEISMIPISDSLSGDELSVLNKLEAFGMIRKEKSAYKPVTRFYKYAEKLIEQEIPVEEFDFDDQPSAHQTFNNTIHAQSIGQINQGSGNFSFEQINIEVVKKSLENELSEEQLNEVMMALEQNGQKGVAQKLKSFGSDVLANVIAGILSNPALYS